MDRVASRPTVLWCKENVEEKGRHGALTLKPHGGIENSIFVLHIVALNMAIPRSA